MDEQVDCSTLFIYLVCGSGGFRRLPANKLSMLRFLAQTCLHLLANAVGLIVATLMLPDFSIDAVAFITVTVVFTLVEVIAGPFLISVSVRNAPALTGGIALLTTLVGLLITDFVTDGLTINGVRTWVLASLTVWVCALIAQFVLPLFLFRKILADRGSSRGRR